MPKKQKSKQCYRFAVRVTDEDLPASAGVDLFKLLAKKWVFSIERGLKAGKRHFQGRLSCHNKHYAGRLAKDIAAALGLEPASVYVAPEADQAGSTFYCMKLDGTHIEGPFSDRPIYKAKDLECMENPLPWQAEVLGWLAQEPDDRTIRWIYDEKGNFGKSKLCKWLEYTEQAKGLGLGTASQIKTSAITAGPSRCYVIDLPRVRGSDESREAVFSAIESVKAGNISSTMYGKNAKLFMEPPHVIVFSNEMPDFSMASADRWKVFVRQKDGGLKRWREPKPLDIEEFIAGLDIRPKTSWAIKEDKRLTRELNRGALEV